MRKVRVDYLDLCRGIAISLIVIGHFISNTVIQEWIYSFHVPVFFIISGFILKISNVNKINLKQYISKRIRKLIVPYYFFSIINTIPLVIVKHFEKEYLIDNVFNILILNGFGALWFLPCLFIAELLFIILEKNLNSKLIKAFFIIIMFMLTLKLQKSNNSWFYIIIGRSIIALIYVYIGYYIYRYIRKVKVTFINIVILFLINFTLSQINGMVELYHLKFNNIFIYFSAAITGSIALIMLSIKFNNINIINYWGKNSLIIMSTHQFIINIIVVLLRRDITNFIQAILVFISIMTIEYIIIKIINNKLPILIGSKRGKGVVMS